MTAFAGLTERDISIVDLFERHRLREGRCGCGDFAGTESDHRRHLGAWTVAHANRIMARVTQVAAAQIHDTNVKENR